MNHNDLKFIREGNYSRVVADGTDLMQLRVGDLYMGGAYIAGGIRFHPRHRTRIANLISFWPRFVPRWHPARVAICAEPTTQGLRVRVQPDTRGGIAEVEDVFEFQPDPRSGGWMITHRGRIVLRRRVAVRELHLTRFPDPSGRPARWWEIDDPNFDGNYGPSVPMVDDWLGIYEPTCGPDTFRQHWQRRVEQYVYQEPSERIRTIRFHRGLLCSLSRHNRRALPFRRGGFAGILHTDGTGTLYEFTDNQPTFGHICEWGFDTHFWRRIPGDPDQAVLPKGHTLEMSYRVREVPRADMQKLLAHAKPIVPTEREWRNTADLPIYEEPVNHFAIAWRADSARDAWPWTPGLGASWDRKVGRKRPGSLKIEVPLSPSGSDVQWTSPRVGPSNFMNPLVPGARYRLSGFVKFRPNPGNSEVGIPSLAMTFHKYAGPATFAPEIQPGETFSGTVRGRIHPGRWTRIKALSGPITGHVMGVTLGCHLSGNGIAWFDEIRFEKAD